MWNISDSHWLISLSITRPSNCEYIRCCWLGGYYIIMRGRITINLGMIRHTQFYYFSYHDTGLITLNSMYLYIVSSIMIYNYSFVISVSTWLLHNHDNVLSRTLYLQYHVIDSRDACTCTTNGDFTTVALIYQHWWIIPQWSLIYWCHFMIDPITVFSLYIMHWWWCSQQHIIFSCYTVVFLL